MRDPAVYFTLLLSTVFIQTLIWSIARQVTDTEWWHAFNLAIVSTVGACVVTYFTHSPANMAAAYGAFVFVIWIVSGMQYDFYIWQRITVSLISPGLAFALLLFSALMLEKLKAT